MRTKCEALWLLVMILGVLTLLPSHALLAADAQAGEAGQAAADASTTVEQSPATGRWEIVSSPTTWPLYSVTTVSPTEGWAVGWNGTILHYTDGSWQVVPSPVELPLYAVAMASPAEGWAVGHRSLTFRYTGGSWQWVSGPPFYQEYLSLAVASPTEFWAAGTCTTYLLPASDPCPAVIVHHRDGATRIQWSDYRNVAVYSLAMAPPTDGWAVGDSGLILQYTGDGWMVVPSPTSKNLFSVAMVSPTEGWAVGEGGTILRRTRDDWRAVSSPTTNDLRSIAMASSTEGWAVGVGGIILRYTNGSWQVVPSPTSEDLHSIAMASPTEGWAVGNDGTILHYSVPRTIQISSFSLEVSAAAGDATVSLGRAIDLHDVLIQEGPLPSATVPFTGTVEGTSFDATLALAVTSFDPLVLSLQRFTLSVPTGPSVDVANVGAALIPASGSREFIRSATQHVPGIGDVIFTFTGHVETAGR